MKKGTKHSEETKRIMSESQRGKKHPFYGKQHSQETKRKIILARAKQVITDESNKKRSETLKGRKFSKESLEKMKQHALKRFSNKENHPSYKRIISKEERKSRSKALKGRKLEELHSKEKVEEIRNKIKKSRAKQIFPIKDTLIEVKIQNFLKQLGIEFFTHQRINIKHSYQCDILIPSKNLVIECDGDYWHNYPTGTDIDHIRTSELLKSGFRVLRLWEFEIKDMELNYFKEKIR